ncbi:MAG: hypothetical protein ACLGG0_14670 [Bacteriovoracia bacterium]
MKLTIFAALLMMSLAAFAEGENASGNVTGPDCEGAVADSSGVKPDTTTASGDTSSKPAAGATGK